MVGPESAGAHPGPVCYCKGGPLTVTDANLALGRLLPQYFPQIFGPDGKQPLDKEATLREFKKLTNEVNIIYILLLLLIRTVLKLTNMWIFSYFYSKAGD